MVTSTIRYLDAPQTISVETPVAVSIGWGDRACGTGGNMLAVWTAQDANGVRVTVGADGSVRADRAVGSDWYPCDLPSYAEEVIAAHRAVNAAAQTAERDNPAIAAACHSYRDIVAKIHRDLDEHERMWRDVWAPAIARKFHRRNVQIGEQTVPGKHCVRSVRGNLLGYANCWDGRWLGTIERL